MHWARVAEISHPCDLPALVEAFREAAEDAPPHLWIEACARGYCVVGPGAPTAREAWERGAARRCRGCLLPLAGPACGACGPAEPRPLDPTDAAARGEFGAALRYFARYPAAAAYSEGGYEGSPLQAAARRGHAPLVELLAVASPAAVPRAFADAIAGRSEAACVALLRAAGAAGAPVPDALVERALGAMPGAVDLARAALPALARLRSSRSGHFLLLTGLEWADLRAAGLPPRCLLRALEAGPRLWDAAIADGTVRSAWSSLPSGATALAAAARAGARGAVESLLARAAAEGAETDPVVEAAAAAAGPRLREPLAEALGGWGRPAVLRGAARALAGDGPRLAALVRGAGACARVGAAPAASLPIELTRAAAATPEGAEALCEVAGPGELGRTHAVAAAGCPGAIRALARRVPVAPILLLAASRGLPASIAAAMEGDAVRAADPEAEDAIAHALCAGGRAGDLCARALGAAARCGPHVLAARGYAATLAAAGTPAAAARDAGGRTPLHVAAAHDRLLAAGALVRAGADPNARDARGRGPLWFARSGEMAALLLAAGAEPEPDLAWRAASIPALAGPFAEHARRAERMRALGVPRPSED